jgi:7-carboxy-7-deazaguanine synthase
MSYWVKESFYSLQGEGAQTGRAAVFCRFAGCNLWSGREQDRDRAICRFCDTDFRGTDGDGGGRYREADALAEHLHALWSVEADASGCPYVVCTGGEPLLQLDVPLIDALHRHGFEVAVETNGTRPAPPGLDWICVSPKAGATTAIDRRRRTQADLSTAWSGTRAVREPGFPAFLPATHGWAAPRR